MWMVRLRAGECGRFELEKRMLHKNRALVWIKLAVSALWPGQVPCMTHIATIEDISSRKANEQALREANERLSLAQTAAQFGTWEYDFATSIAECDAYVRAVFGLPGTGVITQADFLRRTYPADRAAVLASIQAALTDANDGNFAVEQRVLRDGDCWIAATGKIYQSHTGPRLIGILQDITARKRTEFAQLRDAAILQAYFDNANLIAWVKDSDHRYVYLNARYLARFDDRDYLGKTKSDLWPADYAARFQQDHEDLLADEQPRERLDEVPDNRGKSKFWLCHEFVFRDAAGARYVGGTGIESTARIKAEQSQRTSEARLRAFLDNSNFMAWIKDADGRYVFANETFMQRNGVVVSDSSQISDFDLWPAEVVKRFHLIDRQVIDQQRAMEYVDDHGAPNGAHNWWLKHKFPLTDQDGKQYVGALAIDITERTELRIARDELRQLSRGLQVVQEEERKRIAREIHDEFGGTLSMIKGSLYRIEKEVATSPARFPAILEQLRAMIDALLLASDTLVHRLRPPSLDHLGLDVTLRRLIKTFLRSARPRMFGRSARPLPDPSRGICSQPVSYCTRGVDQCTETRVRNSD
ncbi:MAG: PAS domain S-box protein [Gammaproteobacteria bacterium]|nr:PAS domain S-box protein [Gammaproteobacteria bacterium]